MYIINDTYDQVKTDLFNEHKNYKKHVIDFAIYIIEYFEKNEIKICNLPFIFFADEYILFTWDKETEIYTLEIHHAYIDFYKNSEKSEDDIDNIFRIDLTKLNFPYLDLNKIDIIIKILELNNYSKSRNFILECRDEYYKNIDIVPIEYDDFNIALYILNYLKMKEHITCVSPLEVCIDPVEYVGCTPYSKRLIMKFEYSILYLFDGRSALYKIGEEDRDKCIPEMIFNESHIVELCDKIIRLENFLSIMDE